MSIDRRQFLAAASAMTMVAVTPGLAASRSRVDRVATAPSHRSVVNVGYISGNEYRFIDHFLIVEQFGPVDNWSRGPTWMQSIGSNGYPEVSIKASENKTFGGGLRIPASFSYGAPGSGQYYVLRWKGNGEVKLTLNSGSWTYYAGRSSNVTQVASDRWKTTVGSDTYIVLGFTGPAQLFPLYVLATDPNRAGANLHSLQFYRLEDEVDLQAGKVFRRPYKQSIIDLCPSAVRFMDWIGGNNSKLTRFESRTRPDYAAWGGGSAGSNWVTSPPYGETTGANHYFLAAAPGMPANPIQGEIVTCRIGSGMVRSGAKAVTAVTNSNPGRITAPVHGFASGDIIVHCLPEGVMPRLHLFPCTITVIDQDSYSIAFDTTAFGLFKGAAQATQFITLDVGGRGAYPVTFSIPTTPASNFGNGYIAAGDYKTFVFDGTIAAQTDGAGKYVYGVWMFNDVGANNGHDGGVPLEICTALVNELNEMQPSHPINMWMNIPHLGLCSMDPDHTIGSNWGIRAVDVVLNGANGFAGLTDAAQLFIEFSNETWNSGGSSFSQTYYCAYRGYLRWPASGQSDYGSMASLRSVINVEDIRTSVSSNPRLKFVLAGQGTLGVSGMNAARIDGTQFYLKDPLNLWGSNVAPMVHHDFFAFAGYFTPLASFDEANLANCTAIWAANVDNAAAQEAACAAYVRGLVDPKIGGPETVDRYRLKLLPAYAAKMTSYGKSVVMYEGGWDHDIQPVSAGWLVTGSIPFASGMFDGRTGVITGVDSKYLAALAPGDFVVGYGIPPMTRVVHVFGTSIRLTNATTIGLGVAQFVAFKPQQMFLRAVKRSQSWTTAMLAFFDQFGSASGMPSEYAQNDLRWGHTYPTAYGFGNTEWGDLDLAWQQEGSRNRALD